MTPFQAAHWALTPGAVPGDAVASMPDGGALRLAFLSASTARVTWVRPDGFREPATWAIAPTAGEDVPWQGRLRGSLAGFSRPSLTVRNLSATDSNSAPSLETTDLRVTLAAGVAGTPRLIWQAPTTGQVYMADRATSAYLASKRTGAIRHCVVRDPTDRYFGLGDKTGPLNLHGRRLRCMGQDSLGYDPQSGDPLYKHWPFLMQRTPDGLWQGIYYDTLSACTFDLGCEHDNYHDFFRTIEIDDGDLDYYIMVGDSPAAVLHQFMSLIGGTHLPPKWSVGFALTAMGLADAPDAQQQLTAFIAACGDNRMPISAFHYGSGYSSRGKQRYVFNWNRDKFPDPEGINRSFQEAGMRLVANIKPCLLDDHPAYQAVRDADGFINNRSTGEPVVEPFWDGNGAYLDFTKPQAVQWWQSGLRQQILEKGIDSGWNDNNEYAIQSEDAVSDLWGQAGPIHRSRPLHALLMTRATFEAQTDYATAIGRDEAVYTITRAGPPGLQRYAQTWSGDNTTSWETLKWNIRTGLQMSLSGMFNVGHDVGGFFGPSPEPELLARWVQACALNPRMVMNSWKPDGKNNLPWMHDSVTDDIRAALNLRYQLMPYLWACFERACQFHQPIIRPTFFNFPHDEGCFADCDDFMLGDYVLVAPVVEKGAQTRAIYLPKLPDGGQWVDFYDRSVHLGGHAVTCPAPIGRLPLMVRQGARIPVAVPPTGQVPRHDDPVTDVLEF
ncbi:glycoside hydrolase family 31 protein [Betaproteobacteria bacterium LSUCC0117]|nr:glycoside hydrolase family 31 protein [Betaproteobacteria bacterium LSUCC0117]